MSLAAQFGIGTGDHPMRKIFLGWQCRVRQMMMRDEGGRPTDAITPSLTLPGSETPMGHIITLMSKLPAYSVTPELTFMAQKTPDTAKWREEALTFSPHSTGAATIRAADRVTLAFDAYGQRFDLECKVWKLSRRNPLYQATTAHNRLFNPGLHPDTEVLGFEPNWDQSSSNVSGR
jgi:hypothetical protein